MPCGRTFCLGVAVVAAVGCTASPGANPVPERPTAVGTMALAATAQALPGALASDPHLLAAGTGDGTWLVGGQMGLFVLNGSAFQMAKAEAVVAMTAVSNAGVLVAFDSGLALWRGGALSPTPLAMQLTGLRVQALAAADGRVWIGTDSDLYVSDGERLVSLPDLKGVDAIAAAHGTDAVIVHRSNGEAAALKVEGGSFAVHRLSGELDGARFAPGTAGDIFAVVGRALWVRIAGGDGVADWRRFALTTDSADHGAEDVDALAVDPSAGDLWILAGGRVMRLRGSAVDVAAAPSGAGTSARFVATDGVPWLVSDAQLLQLAPSGDPGPSPSPGPSGVSYTKDIAAFSHTNCERCHSETAMVAFPLTSYDAWVAHIDQAISAVSEKRMPQDGRPLVGGDVSLLVSWKAQGMTR